MFGEIASGRRRRCHNVPECRRDVRRVAVGDLDDMTARARFEAAAHERANEKVSSFVEPTQGNDCEVLAQDILRVSATAAPMA
jgi:hypothetical protein